MADYSNHQRKLINRYYDNRDDIMLTKVQELVTELFLAETPAKQEKLWDRVRKAMGNLKIKPAVIDHIVNSKDPSVLASNIQDWLKGSVPKVDAPSKR
ncbi:MAG: hypothetical protein GXP29_09450 [Planctomycetes bacterium]|nr:hypothetical protein [Planctomycetota bacterium]